MDGERCCVRGDAAFDCCFHIAAGDSANRALFLVKVVGSSLAAMALGLTLYYRGVQAKKREASGPDRTW